MINPLSKKTFLAFILLLTAFGGYSQGYNIHLTLKPFTNAKIYLGYHYGKVKAVADSVILDNNSEGIFKGKGKIGRGDLFYRFAQKRNTFRIIDRSGSAVFHFC